MLGTGANYRQATGHCHGAGGSSMLNRVSLKKKDFPHHKNKGDNPGCPLTQSTDTTALPSPTQPLTLPHGHIPLQAARGRLCTDQSRFPRLLAA